MGARVKKRVTQGCEPMVVTSMFKTARPFVDCRLAGLCT